MVVDKMVITWNKKHLLKQVVSKTRAIVKNIFADATFEGL